MNPFEWMAQMMVGLQTSFWFLFRRFHFCLARFNDGIFFSHFFLSETMIIAMNASKTIWFRGLKHSVIFHFSVNAERWKNETFENWEKKKKQILNLCLKSSIFHSFVRPNSYISFPNQNITETHHSRERAKKKIFYLIAKSLQVLYHLLLINI